MNRLEARRRVICSGQSLSPGNPRFGAWKRLFRSGALTIAAVGVLTTCGELVDPTQPSVTLEIDSDSFVSVGSALPLSATIGDVTLPTTTESEITIAWWSADSNILDLDSATHQHSDVVFATGINTGITRVFARVEDVVLGAGVTASLDVTVLPRLMFAGPPGDAELGRGFEAPIRVLIQDGQGNPDSSDSSKVRLFLVPPTSEGTEPVDFALLTDSSCVVGAAALAVSPVAGVAEFTNLVVCPPLSGATSFPRTNYRLIANATHVSGAQLTSATSDTFDLVDIPRLRIKVDTPVATAGEPLGVEVVFESALGNIITSADDSVTLSIIEGTGASGTELLGPATERAVAGEASFPGVHIDVAGVGYVLEAVTQKGDTGRSEPLEIQPGPAVALEFAQSPVNTTAGFAIPPVGLAAKDALGNTATSYANTDTVRVVLDALVIRTDTVTFVDGETSYSVVLNSAATGYTLEAIASDTAVRRAVSDSFDVLLATASALEFTGEPGDAVAGAPIAGVTVSVLDSAGNLATTFSARIAVSITPVTNPLGANLRGFKELQAQDGKAVFEGLSIDSAGSGYTLDATAGGLTKTSAAFAIRPGAADTLVFTTPPQDTTAGSQIPLVTIAAHDSVGNVDTSFADSVRMTIAAGTGAAGAALTGTTSVKATNGLASFSDLLIDDAAAGYRLRATAGSLATNSAAFDIGAGIPIVTFSGEPGNTVAGEPISGVEVKALDIFGNLATGLAASVTIAIEAGTGTDSAALSGTTTVALTEGVAAFDDLTIDSAGTGYLLEATLDAPGSLPVSSRAFVILPGATSQIGFVTQPSSVVAGSPVIPAVRVAARDSFGNTATGFTDSISMAIVAGSGTAGASLSGGTRLAAVLGVATFNDLGIDSAGTAYKLAAQSGSFTIQSDTFAVTTGDPLLVFSGQPTATTAGDTMSAVTVTAQDALGNRIATFDQDVSIAIASGTGTTGASLRGTTSISPVDGVASFSDLSLDSAGVGYVLRATANSVTAVNSSTFSITPGTADTLVFQVQPVNTGAGVPIPAIKVAALDSLGNVATSFSGDVTIAITAGTGTVGAALAGTATVTAVDGVATFSVSIDLAGTGFTLDATSGTLATKSDGFDIT